jgi:ribosomal protein S18 acetylase RimI-like enzyme
VETIIGSGTFRVVRAGASDAALLADVGARTFVEAFAADNDPADIERYVAESFSVARLSADLAASGSTFLLAYDDAGGAGAPVGYAHLRDGANEHVEGQRQIGLVRIYIEPAAIGRGYGSALLRACLDVAAHGGSDTIWLGVWEHNHRARRFYERQGFRRVGDQAFVLGTDVQTDHIMARAVRPVR